MVLSKNAKLANKQKSTFDKANKNKGFSKVQQFPRIEEITKISKKRMHQQILMPNKPSKHKGL